MHDAKLRLAALAIVAVALALAVAPMAGASSGGGTLTAAVAYGPARQNGERIVTISGHFKAASSACQQARFLRWSFVHGGDKMSNLFNPKKIGPSGKYSVVVNEPDAVTFTLNVFAVKKKGLSCPGVTRAVAIKAAR